jgi:hypothetical protein
MLLRSIKKWVVYFLPTDYPFGVKNKNEIKFTFVYNKMYNGIPFRPAFYFDSKNTI